MWKEKREENGRCRKNTKNAESDAGTSKGEQLSGIIPEELEYIPFGN